MGDFIETAGAMAFVGLVGWFLWEMLSPLFGG